MMKAEHLNTLNWYISMVGLFSIGCIVGAVYPNIPFVVWIGLLFAVAVIKTYISHQSQKLEKSEEQRKNV